MRFVLWLYYTILFLFFLFPVSIFAQTKGEFCLPNGYTVLTINGMNTDDKKASQNMRDLRKNLPPTYKNEELLVDYLLNPSHLAGLGDIFAVAYQKYFDTEVVEDYDLIEILNDASEKVKTQKLLLVGHSQGNFYSNSFYDKVVDKEGGVPKESISVYGVASPSSRVAGGGKYMTSGSDAVISKIRWMGILNILPSNEYIKLPEGDASNGHSFSDVYMKYRSGQIISDVKYSLNKLKPNDIQEPDKPCLNPPEITLGHKIAKVVFAVADPTAVVLKKSAVDTYNDTKLAFKNGFKILGNVISGGKNSATAIVADGQSSESSEPKPVEENPEPQDLQAPVAEEKIVEEIEEVKEPDPEPEIVPDVEVNLETNVVENNITVEQTADVNEEPEEEKEVKKKRSGGGGGGGSSDPIPTPPDTTPPVITITGDNPTDVEKNSIYTDAGATATDNVDGVIAVVTTGTVDTSLVGSYQITYTATDSSNNISSLVRTINVIDTTPPPDTTPPVITLIGASTLSIALNSTFTDPGVTATDNIDGAITPVVTGTVDTTTAGIYILTYTATDAASNVSNKTRTVSVSTGAKLNQPKSVFVSGDYAYVVSENSNALEIVNVSDPENPTHASYINNDTSGVALFSPKSVFVSGNYAYVVSYSNNLQIFNISNPLSPTLAGTLNHGDGGAGLSSPVSVVVSGNHAYIASYGGHNVEIVDVSNPASPSHVSSISFGLPITTTAVAVVGNYLYATFLNTSGGGGGLRIFDISSPSSPISKGVVEHAPDGASIDNPQSVFIDGDYAYITSRGDNTFEIVDVSNVELPVHKGKVSNGAGNAALLAPIHAFIDNDYAYVVSFVGDTLEVLDISNPTNPAHAGTLADGEDGAELSSPTSVFVLGDYAYITSSQGDALEIVDISNPSNPVHVGKISDGEF